ncbi:hypothetical protein BRADI_1g46285v3 [Brachypodium distachyon]|uniref:Reverse transcriptase zinc-binding domain-containing protein n=1 Tax=Brachypodium distachyon TaxID=15368 RepID=A0A2K2DPP7_BRADI|nr:hypothetical protein BRADI_1g46285v3 [Brachypodium distachyon]
MAPLGTSRVFTAHKVRDRKLPSFRNSETWQQRRGEKTAVCCGLSMVLLRVARPWVGLPTPCDASDRALFRTATKITLGNGDTAQFWHDAWLPDGSSPAQRWPRLLAISTRKQRMVQKELTSHNWVRSLLKIDTAEQMADFVELWTCICDVQLSTRADAIAWRWSTSGTYSAASAQKAQFNG